MPSSKFIFFLMLPRQARGAPSLSEITLNSPHVRWRLDLRHEFKGDVRQTNDGDDGAGNDAVPFGANADGTDEEVD
jgi:hypothetical protein